MPNIEVNGVRIHYQIQGDGPETIVFSHGLLMGGQMFRPQIEALSDRYRCISYDHRGQGRSEVTRDGYDIDTVAEDAVALIGALGCAPVHFAGLSMGGFVGLRLAIHHPGLLRSLILMDTSADPEPEPNKGPYRRLAFVGRWLGFRLVVEPVMKILFGRTYLSDPSRAKQRARWRNHLLGLNRKGTARAARGVIDRSGVYDQLGRIGLPTLIVVGEEDLATPPEKSQRMHEAIEDSTLILIPKAGHSPTIEAPEAVTRAVESFLDRVPGS